MEEISLAEQYVSVDEMLHHVGEFGRFQWMIQLLLCVMQFPPTFPSLIMYFAALTPAWRCSTNHNNSFCNSTNRVFPYSDERRCEWPREEWEYVKWKGYSVVTQYDISCANHWYIYLTTSLCFIGMAFGSIAMGYLGDRFGRKRVLFPAMFCLCLVTLLSVFAPTIEWFLASRFLVGFLRSGTSVFMMLVASELTGNRYRPLAGSTLRMILPIANCVMGVQAYYVDGWKNLFILCSAPYLLTVFFYKLVPESVRWLRLRGHHDKVMKTFERIAKFNRKSIPANVFLAPLPKDIAVSKAGIAQLFTTFRRSLSTLNLGWAWMAASIVYFGVSLAADDLGGSIYVNFILVSLVEFPAGLATIYFLNTFGRKKTIIGTLLSGSVGCAALACIPATTGYYKIVRVSLGLVSKFLITVSYSSIYTWTVEIFPTTVRAVGMGFTQFTSRMGAAMAPIVAKGLKTWNPIAPFLFMGVVGIVTSLLLTFLRETKGRPTKETMQRPTAVAVVEKKDQPPDIGVSNKGASC